MNRMDFFAVWRDAIEMDEATAESAVLADLESWDSLAAVTTLALFNQKLSCRLSADKLKACKTVGDLLDLGAAHYAA